MTKLLEQAIAKVRELPPMEQDEIAQRLLSDLADDAKWDATTLKHASQLRKLADEAQADFEAGRTEELDPDHL